MLCSNIAGLRNNFSELKYVIKNCNPEIVILNETHLTELCDNSDLKLTNYQSPINCFSHSTHTGGVSVFVKKNIRINNINVIQENTAWYLSFETIVNNEPTIFAGLYLSADARNKPIVIQSYEKWIESLQLSKPVIICGDFNINMLIDTTFSRKLSQICDDCGLQLLTDTCTRVSDNSATMIDLCYSNLSQNNITCIVSSENQISDHAILEITVYGKRDLLPTKTRSICVWKNYNENQLWQSLEANLESWYHIENESIDQKINWLLNAVSSSTDQFKCVKLIKTNDDFFDQELEMMRKKKNELYKRAQSSLGSINATNNWHHFKKFKNKYKNTIQSKKFENNQRKLNRVNGNMKETWRVLNQILCKEIGEITRIKHDNNEFNDDYEIANEFNKYFINSINEINDSIPNITFIDEIVLNQNLSFEFRAVSINEIKCCLKELKNSTDEYFVNPRVLLDAVFVIL